MTTTPPAGTPATGGSAMARPAVEPRTPLPPLPSQTAPPEEE